MGNPCWMLSAEVDVWSCSCLHNGVLWGCRDNGKGNGNYCIIMEVYTAVVWMFLWLCSKYASGGYSSDHRRPHHFCAGIVLLVVAVAVVVAAGSDKGRRWW